MKIHVWRILGSDLPKRHHPQQTYNNLKFILENEPDFPNVHKYYFLNRILFKESSSLLTSTLLKQNQLFHIDPFSPGEYQTKESFDEKVQYLTNLNLARNACLQTSFDEGADYVLPLDGASFLRQDLAQPIFDLIQKDCPPFIAIPQSRVHSYEVAKDLNFVPDIYEDYYLNGQTHQALRELTVAFSKFSDVRFNENLLYGQVDKVELLWRIGLDGFWNHWHPEIREQALKNKSQFYGTVPQAGTVIRLPDGMGPLNNQERGRRRLQGLKEMVTIANRMTGKFPKKV